MSLVHRPDMSVSWPGVCPAVPARCRYWVGEEHWNRRIVTEAVRQVPRYAFEHLPILKIFAYVFGSNPASRRVLEKAGFEQEACLNPAVEKNGRAMDLYYSGYSK